MNRRVILVGGGEHARVIADLMRVSGWGEELLGVVDPSVVDVDRLGVPHLGGDEVLSRYPGTFGIIAFATLSNWERRLAAADRLAPWFAGWAKAVHPRAWVSPSAEISGGAVIMAGALVQTGARVGAHCVINSGAIVEHDVVLGRNVHLGPGAIIGGGARVGDNTFIGLGAKVRDHITIADRALVAMGAVVIDGVSAGARVRGIPAR